MRTLALVSVFGASLSVGCAGNVSGDSSLADESMELVSVSAKDIAALPRGRNFEIDLGQANVVYQLDGTAAQSLDLSRIDVITPAADHLSLNDFIKVRHIEADAQHISLRLAGDPMLMLSDDYGSDDAADVQSTTQALRKSPGGGGAGFTCGGGLCGCHGYDDCIEMMGSGVCAPNSGWCDSDNANPTCGCIM